MEEDMQRIIKEYCNVGIRAIVRGYKVFMRTKVADLLLSSDYGKSDTLGFDAVLEIEIKEEIYDFDQTAILVTEETDDITTKYWPENPDKFLQPLMYFCDPVDRSSYLKAFLGKFLNEHSLMAGEIINREDSAESWEKTAIDPEGKKIAGGPVSITGATSAITCVSKGSVVFSAIVNIITQTIYVACPIGIFNMKLPDYLSDEIEKVDIDYICRQQNKINFPSAKEVCKNPQHFQRFVTFLGKNGYEENFNDSKILSKEDAIKYLHHKEPGGPSRVLYLSEFQDKNSPVGFVLANGEKIGEWIHWLSFVKYAKNFQNNPTLKIFEVKIKRPWTKEGIIMSPSGPYSIFRHKKGEDKFLNISRLRDFDRPSHFRAMIVITLFDNETIINNMRRKNYKEVSESL